MDDRTGWVCTYRPPGRKRSPFDSRKLRDITRRVCEEEGAKAAAQGAMAGIWDCSGAGESICETIRALERAAHIVRETLEDWDSAVSVVVRLLEAGWITKNAALTIELVYEVLASQELEDDLHLLSEWLHCAGFSTGGGFGGDEPGTGGGY